MRKEDSGYFEKEVLPKSVQFGVGAYVMKDDDRAVVARTRQLGMTWVLDGAIFNPNTQTWNFTSWLLNGEHTSGDERFDLKEKIT
jgi:hypothetical protein